MANMDSDIEKIEKLIALMKENDLVEVEIAHGDNKIGLKRQQIQPTTFVETPISTKSAIPTPESATPVPNESLEVIPSPLVGTFYTAPSPDSKAFVENGDHVDPSTVVCIIEAMKVMNEIKAETSGTIVEMLVENGAAVEFGQALYRVRPD